MVAGRWIRAKIGDCSIVGDGAHARIQRQTSGVMYLTSRNLKDGCIDLSKVDYISNDDFERHFRDDSKALTKPKADDVVFSIIGTIGEPYLVQKQDRFGISSSVAILRPNCQVVQPQYVYYWIKGHIFQDALYGIKGGVAQGYVSLEMIRSLPLYYPPLPTQRKIAAILSAYDDLIENNTRRIAVLEEMAQAIYREWFVHFRFPGYEGVRMVESELGPVPEGWKVVCYSDILQSFLGGDWGKETPTEKEDHPVTVIRGTDFNDVTFGNMLRTPHRYISEASVAKRKLIPGDVIVENSVNASSRCVGSSLLVTQEMLNQIRSDAICASFCKSFRPKSQQFGVLIDLHIKYLYAENKMPFYQNIATNGIGNFQAKRFVQSESLVVPRDQELLDYLTSCLQNLSDLRATHAARNDTLRQTRDLLLPRLISGELDVSELEIETGG